VPVGQAGLVLLTWIREIADEPLLIDPAERKAEHRENTWHVSASAEDRRSVSAREVVAAFETCAARLRERIRVLGYTGAATFYVWHDEQAGQLRCSTTSLPRDRLPFGAQVDPDAPLEEIVQAHLDDASPGVIPWEELDEVPFSDPDEPPAEPYVVPVWTVAVGGALRGQQDAGTRRWLPKRGPGA
jgi:hypothetical protein